VKNARDLAIFNLNGLPRLVQMSNARAHGGVELAVQRATSGHASTCQAASPIYAETLKNARASQSVCKLLGAWPHWRGNLWSAPAADRSASR